MGQSLGVAGSTKNEDVLSTGFFARLTQGQSHAIGRAGLGDRLSRSPTFLLHKIHAFTQWQEPREGVTGKRSNQVWSLEDGQK